MYDNVNANYVNIIIILKFKVKKNDNEKKVVSLYELGILKIF